MAEQVAIKPDPEANGGSPMALDDDAYEDAGDIDLEFYQPILPGDQKNPEDDMILSRVPKYLWSAWGDLDDDAPVEIGKVRRWMDPKTGQPRMAILLNPGRAEHQNLPKEYNLDVLESNMKNTFVFTEADLESYKAKNKARQEAAEAGIPSHLLRSKIEKPAQNQGGKRGRQESFRKVIPKRTRIAGRLRTEVSANPIENEETQHILYVRAQEAVKPKSTLKIVDHHILRSNVAQAGTATGNKAFSSFIKTGEKTTKAKRAEMKTARMPENELLDKIFLVFGEYKYWSMKALRGRIPQPEAYLRSTLEKVADLHKSGRFANTWSLKPEHERPAEGVAEMAPDANIEDSEGEGDGDEDDENIKMEDVM